jgi:hypothetical protein
MAIGVVMQLSFPPPWGRPFVDLLAKIVEEGKYGIQINYHFRKD